MNEKEERAYVQGSKAAYRAIMQQAMTGLGADATTAQEYTIERSQALAALRQVCADHGDNDWQDDLHLADIIDKHLGQHLDREEIESPTEPGWYLARMKTWAIGNGFAPVKVTRYDSSTLHVWQCGDERWWPVDAWDWRARIYP